MTTVIGNKKREQVLREAMHVASREGLNGLSLGRLAETTGWSKSSLQSLFGTKEALQLAIIESAVRVWQKEVLEPASKEADGLPRLRVLAARWIDYLETFEGGCLFISGAAELDATTGMARDAIANASKNGQDLLRREAKLAVRLGELPINTDVEQLVFQLHALLLKANHDRQLFGTHEALVTAHHLLASLLP